VAGKPSLPRKQDIVFKHSAPGQPNLCHDETTLPDPHVVRDLYEVVDLATGTYHRVTYAAAIYGRVRSDLDIIFKIAAAHML
jgi:hypothetical protein